MRTTFLGTREQDWVANNLSLSFVTGTINFKPLVEFNKHHYMYRL